MTGADFTLRLTRPVPSPDSEAARYERGHEVIEQIMGPAGTATADAVSDVAPSLVQNVVAYGFGDVWSQEDLIPARRQLVTLGALTALGGCERQLQAHVQAALNVGLTPAEIVAAVTHAAVYCGFPRALNAMTVVREVLVERGLPPSLPSQSPS